MAIERQCLELQGQPDFSSLSHIVDLESSSQNRLDTQQTLPTGDQGIKYSILC